MVNLIRHGGFDGYINSDYWTGGNIFQFTGYPRSGCAELADDGVLAQAVTLSKGQAYTLHYFLWLTEGSGLFVRCGGNIIWMHGVAPYDVWQEAAFVVGVDADMSTEVRFSAANGTVYVDSVALIAGGLAISRAEVASVVATRLGGLATDRGLSAAASNNGPEGDYTAAINEALRQLGALSDMGDPDITALPASDVDDLIEDVRLAMLRRLRSDYALQTDVTLGPRREARSQIADSIDKLLSDAGANRRVSSAPLRRDNSGWQR